MLPEDRADVLYHRYEGGGVTIDGPSGTGKGTIAEGLASLLGWHLLDTGALYRCVGLAAVRRGTPLDQGAALGDLANALGALGRTEPALAAADEGLAINRALGRDREVAAGLARSLDNRRA